MSRRGVVNAAVAIVAIVITSGMATLAVLGHHVPGDRTEMVAADIDALDAVRPESPSSTAAPIGTAPTTAPRARSATTLPNGSITLSGSPASDPDTAVAPETTTAPAEAQVAPPVGNLAPPLPPASAVVQTGPGSWVLEAEGVTVTASISPVAPRVGDTVTVSYTTSGDGDFCCLAFVYVDGTLVDQNEMPTDPCPLPGETSGSTSVVVGEAGLVRLQVQGSRFTQLCTAPPVFATANLRTTFLVRP